LQIAVDEEKMTPSLTVRKEELQEFVANLLIAAKGSSEDAEIVSESLVWADLRGRHEHGVSFLLPTLIRMLVRSLIHSPATMKWTKTAPATYQLDAGHGFGQVAGCLAMEKAISLASTQGIGLVAVRQSNHYGAAAYYSARAAEAGCIGFTCTNSFPRVAPFGGSQPLLGTNPLAFACPTASGSPVLVDFATAALAGLSIRKMSENGGQLPPGVALDADGQPTTNPSAVAKGCLLPAAGPKGFGLGLMVEIFSGLLTGAAMGREIGSFFNTWDRPANLGHVFIAIHIDHFMPIGAFTDRLQTLLGWIVDCPSQHGAEPVRFPGELRSRYAALYERSGIPLEIRAVQVLDQLADELTVRRLCECRLPHTLERPTRSSTHVDNDIARP
jgi:LDH2 family malate/lactate/ureidoglycolate dehydrogenase